MRKSLVWILVCFSLVMMTSIGFSNRKLKAQAVLETGDVDAAFVEYKLVLEKLPNLPEANFGYAITVFVELLSDEAIHEYLGELGLKNMPKTFKGWVEYLKTAEMPDFSQNNFNFAKDYSALQDRMYNSINNVIEKSLAALEKVKAKKDFALLFNIKQFSVAMGDKSYSGVDFADIDLTEVYALEAALSAISGLFQFSMAHDLTCNYEKLLKMIDLSGKLDYQNFYNPFGDAKFPNFGKLKPDGIARYKEAKAKFGKTIKAAIEMINYLQAENDDQEDDLIPKMTSRESREALDMLMKLDESMAGKYVRFSEELENVPNMSIGRFFDRAPSLRDLLFLLDAKGEPVLYDSTLKLAKNFKNGETYFIRYTNMTFSRFLESDLKMLPEFIPLISSYNTQYSPMFNLVSFLLESAGITPNYPKDEKIEQPKRKNEKPKKKGK